MLFDVFLYVIGGRCVWCVVCMWLHVCLRCVGAVHFVCVACCCGVLFRLLLVDRYVLYVVCCLLWILYIYIVT